MDILNRENLRNLLKDFSENGSVYNTLAGVKNTELSQEEKNNQYKLVDMLERTMGSNSWSTLGTPKGTYQDNKQQFCHIISNDFDTSKVKHRLYFNIPNNQSKFAREFIDQSMLAKKIPTYVKFHKSIDRNDGFVIYTDDQHLESVVSILDEISKLYPEFTVQSELPMASYNCGWFGYAKESTDQSKSFNKWVENTFNKTLADILYEAGHDITEQQTDAYGNTTLHYSYEKLQNTAKRLLENLNDQNSAGFYEFFANRLAEELSKNGLLLDDNTVPKCIMDKSKEFYGKNNFQQQETDNGMSL